MDVYKTKSVYKAPGVYRSGIYKDPSEIPSEDYAEIGGRRYRTTKIGEQIWLAENLDFKFSGLVVGDIDTSDSEPHGNYYDDDESAYGVNGNKYGLLYNWIAVKYLEDNKSYLIPGWHVPTSSEWDALASAVGGTSVAGTKLKSTTDWSSGAGTDDYGFSVPPAGIYIGVSIGINRYTNFWTATEYDSIEAYCQYFDESASTDSRTEHKYFQFSVRLIKD